MPPPDTLKRSNTDLIDGIVLCALVSAGCRAVEANRDRINELNVFPVPDGDTGTNMSLTLRAIAEEAAARPEIHVGETAARMARSALFAARGNSGLISAQLFRGIADAAAGHEKITPAQFAEGLGAGAAAAYTSVPDPREGTMLTIMRVAARSAEECARSGAGLEKVLEAAVESSVAAVAETPTQLDVLRDAGVVDAGGYGLSVFLAGALEQAAGRGDGANEFAPPEPTGVGGAGRTLAGVRIDFVEAVREEVFGYCTVFIIEGRDLDVARIRARATEFGESAVVAGDATAVKIHVHPLDPGPVLSYGAGLGILSGITILNMDEQTAEWAASQRPPPPGSTGPVERLDAAIVAVCSGDGLEAVFSQAGMGACVTFNGGDTMNPSVEEFLDAVERAPADRVVLLPNNPNIVPAARQVPGLTEKEVRVIETGSVQAGIAATFAFSAAAGFESNVAAMTEAAGGVRAGAVTRAVRDSAISGTGIARGDVMALLDGKFVAKFADPVRALAAVVEAAQASELVTVYSGAGVPEPDLERARAAVEKAAGGAEVEIVRGGQPLYDYLVSFE